MASNPPLILMEDITKVFRLGSVETRVLNGIDLTIKDYRWGSTAAGWARHALRDENMAQWLEEAERQRDLRR